MSTEHGRHLRRQDAREPDLSGLPVDGRSRFQIGSVSKTFTGTAVMRLVSQGRVALEDPVRIHLPALSLADDQVARTVTVAHLLNHTAGWDGSVTSGGDDPDGPLSAFVERMAGLEQLSPVGARATYNNAAMALAGRLVETVTGRPFEEALRTLLLEPLGMTRTGFTTDDLVTERCAVGHMAAADGSFSVARPWRWPRAAGPEGGLVSTVEDQLSWAAFHLGDGAAPDGARLLHERDMVTMRTPTVELVGSSLGEAVGLGWFLRDIGGTLTIGHPGATNGQLSELCLVPERRFAVFVVANGTPARDEAHPGVDRRRTGRPAGTAPGGAGAATLRRRPGRGRRRDLREQPVPAHPHHRRRRGPYAVRPAAGGAGGDGW